MEERKENKQEQTKEDSLSTSKKFIDLVLGFFISIGILGIIYFGSRLLIILISPGRKMALAIIFPITLLLILLVEVLSIVYALKRRKYIAIGMISSLMIFPIYQVGMFIYQFLLDYVFGRG